MDEVRAEELKEVTTEDIQVSNTTELNHEETKHLPVVQQLAVALGILVLIFGTNYQTSTSPNSNENKANAETPAPTDQIEEQPENPFADVEITGKSAFVWDMATQRALYNKNADEQLPLASVTKLMTALVAYELLDSEENVNIPLEALLEDGDSGFVDGETFSFQDLTDLMLLSSSNDGAHALAAAAGASLNLEADGARIFVEAMNIRAEEIGLTQTYFNNMTGLDVSTTKAGAYGSARDMAFLMEYILSNYPDLVSRTAKKSASISNAEGNVHYAENTNSITTQIPGLIASKTGYTDLAGGNLLIAFEAGLNRPIIIAVLGSTRNDRFSDVELLSLKAREYVLQQN